MNENHAKSPKIHLVLCEIFILMTSAKYGFDTLLILLGVFFIPENSIWKYGNINY